MKKTFSMLLAVIMAAIAVCTFSVIGFADEANDDPVDSFVTEATTKAPEAATTAAATEAPATTAAPTTTAAPATTEAPATTVVVTEPVTNNSDVAADNEKEPIVTNPEGVTAVIDDETTAAKAPITTKKPAKVDSAIPGTGSSFVPAIALLALAAGTVAVVKTKKED